MAGETELYKDDTKDRIRELQLILDKNVKCGNLLNENILSLSKELDILITEYYLSSINI